MGTRRVTRDGGHSFRGRSVARCLRGSYGSIVVAAEAGRSSSPDLRGLPAPCKDAAICAFRFVIFITSTQNTVAKVRHPLWKRRSASPATNATGQPNPAPHGPTSAPNSKNKSAKNSSLKPSQIISQPSQKSPPTPSQKIPPPSQQILFP